METRIHMTQKYGCFPFSERKKKGDQKGPKRTKMEGEGKQTCYLFYLRCQMQLPIDGDRTLWPFS